MDPNAVLQIVVAVTQVLAFGALIVYVLETRRIANATWHAAKATEQSAGISQKVLENIQASRDEETAPYVVAYLDLPYGTRSIELVVRNIGKTVAHEVRLEFDPPLQSATLADRIGDMPLLRDGIASLAPGQEIRTWIDAYSQYFSAQLPMRYALRVRYRGGLISRERCVNQTLDLFAYHNRAFTAAQGLPELVGAVKELAGTSRGTEQVLRRIANRLVAGLWIRQPTPLSIELATDPSKWCTATLAKLSEMRLLWTPPHRQPGEGMIDPGLADLWNSGAAIAAQLAGLAAAAPPEVPGALVERLKHLVAKLNGHEVHEAFWPNSVEAQDRIADQLVALIESLRDELKQLSVIAGDGHSPALQAGEDRQALAAAAHPSGSPSPEPVCADSPPPRPPAVSGRSSAEVVREAASCPDTYHRIEGPLAE